MFPNLKYDFRRVYKKASPGKSRLRQLFDCFWSQGFQAVVAYRIGYWLVKRHIPIIYLILQRFIEITTGISIQDTTEIGKGLMIQHFGGIIIHKNAKIGDFCTISHGVTIGNKKPGGKSPVISNNVYICAGAKILGDITIGDNCIIGANAVVLDSMPPNSVIGGIPAKVVRSIKDNDAYKEFLYEN